LILDPVLITFMEKRQVHRVRLSELHEKGMDRRGFIERAIAWGVSMLCGGLFAYPVFSFMTFRKSRKRTVIFHSDEQGSDVFFKEGVYLVHEANAPRALSARCTHLGCTLNFDPAADRFRCPCHGSVFERSGKWLSGPAKKDLEHVPMKQAENGDLTAVVTL